MTRTALTSFLAVALLAGCGSESSDRAGGERPVEAKVLTMANVNEDLGELEVFGEAVERISGGRLRIKWLNGYGRGRDGNAEVNLIRDVALSRLRNASGARLEISTTIGGSSPAASRSATRKPSIPGSWMSSSTT